MTTALAPTLWRAFIALAATLVATAAQADAAAWRALASGGHVALMRHALAPGKDDPPGFRLGDCATQRNLNGAGRSQARRAGQAFRRHGAGNVRVYASPWCRCTETAQLLGLGPVTTVAAFGWLKDGPGKQGQISAMMAHIAAVRPGDPSHVLVTHTPNIRALTGVNVASGGIVVVRAEGGRIRVVGRIPPP